MQTQDFIGKRVRTLEPLAYRTDDDAMETLPAGWEGHVKEADPLADETYILSVSYGALSIDVPSVSAGQFKVMDEDSAVTDLQAAVRDRSTKEGEAS